MNGRWGQTWTVDFWGMSSTFWPAELPSDMADAVGVEPTTSGFSDQHSYHDWVLSYTSVIGASGRIRTDDCHPDLTVLQTVPLNHLGTEAWQELRELNSYQWFWRPLFYRWTKLLKNKRWLFLAITHRNLVVDQLYIVSIALFLDAWLLD